MRTEPPAPEPILGPAKAAASLAAVSVPHWRRLHRDGKTPAAVKLGRRTLWRLDELRAWMSAGCPDRQTWEAMK